jgi:hypothetical protein
MMVAVAVRELPPPMRKIAHIMNGFLVGLSCVSDGHQQSYFGILHTMEVAISGDSVAIVKSEQDWLVSSDPSMTGDAG